MELQRGIIERPQKICIYGPEGIGKTYLASRFPNPVFIDTEGGTSHFDVVRTPEPSSWTMMLEQVRYFRINPTVCSTLIIDTADWAEKLCAKELCATAKKDGIEGFGYGKGYTYLSEKFGELLNELTEIINVGITVVINAHATMRKIEQPEEAGAYDHWEMKLTKYVGPMLREWADMILFCNYKTYVVDADGQGTGKGKNKAQGGKRVMYTTHTPFWDAKNRHDLLPELPLDFDEIRHCIPVRNSKPTFTKEEIEDINQENAISGEPSIEEQFEQLGNKEPPRQTPLETFADVTKEVRRDDTPQPRTKPNPFPDLPKALVDLMLEAGVNTDEVKRAVASRGYYPVDMPISKYDPAFIDGVLIGAWPQVLGMIKELETTPL